MSPTASDGVDALIRVLVVSASVRKLFQCNFHHPYELPLKAQSCSNGCGVGGLELSGRGGRTSFERNEICSNYGLGMNAPSFPFPFSHCVKLWNLKDRFEGASWKV